MACIGTLLAGIVFLNVSLLGLNSGIAVTADRAAELRRQNADLRLEVAKLGSTERIQRVAGSHGFVMPSPGDVTYLDADPSRDGRRAALALRRKRSDMAPDATPAGEAETEVAAVDETLDTATAGAPGATVAPAAGAIDAPAPAASAPAPAPPEGPTAPAVPPE